MSYPASPAQQWASMPWPDRVHPGILLWMALWPARARGRTALLNREQVPGPMARTNEMPWARGSEGAVPLGWPHLARGTGSGLSRPACDGTAESLLCLNPRSVTLHREAEPRAESRSGDTGQVQGTGLAVGPWAGPRLSGAQPLGPERIVLVIIWGCALRNICRLRRTFFRTSLQTS